VLYTVTKWKNAGSEKRVTKKKRYPHTGVWLMVDDKNKEVKYQVDPNWINNTTDEEQKSALTLLTMLANEYRRAGYAIFDFIKRMKKE
jgi:hypothetical protein